MLKPTNNNQTYFKMMLIENPTPTRPQILLHVHDSYLPLLTLFLTNILIQIDTSILHF